MTIHFTDTEFSNTPEGILMYSYLLILEYRNSTMQRVQNDKNKHVGNKKYEYLLKSLLIRGYCGRTFDSTTAKGAKDKVTGEMGGPEIARYIVPSLNAEQITFIVEKLRNRLASGDEVLFEGYSDHFG